MRKEDKTCKDSSSRKGEKQYEERGALLEEQRTERGEE
jgi:hypothetical protein